MEHITLVEEAREYKKCLEDMDKIRATIHSASNLKCSHFLVSNYKSMYEILFLLSLYSFFFLALVNQRVDSHEDLKIKFMEGAKERKELYNKVLELKGKL